MSGHTKGPWSVHHFARDSTSCMCTYVFSDYQSGFGSIASVPFGGEDEDIETAKANAVLIAAAPCLLHALQNIENDNGQIPDHAWKVIQDAIAKATTIQ